MSSQNRNDSNKNQRSEIEYLDISGLSFERLNQMCFHFSPKKNKHHIEEIGLIRRIGDNSLGLDKERYIFFAYGLQGVVELWDYWLKWRIDRLYNPWYQKENIKIAKEIKKGSASFDQIKQFYNDNSFSGNLYDSWKKWESPWDKEFISGEYIKDEEKMTKLFEYQIEELVGTNYYELKLIEGDDYSSDEIDLKKISFSELKRYYSL